MIKLLLLEDDDTIAFGIRAALGPKGFAVTCCSDIEHGKQVFDSTFELLLLDLNLPDGSGYDFCRWVKQQGNTPIIFLTVRDDARDITKGLDMGADDYITKPFHIAVLESRIHAVLRRASKENPVESHLLSCGNIQINTQTMQVSVDRRSVSLTSLEYRLLCVLMENKGRILPRNLILEKLWDAHGNFVNDNTLTVAMKRLREKLFHTPYITTIRGIGYCIEEKTENPTAKKKQENFL